MPCFDVDYSTPGGRVEMNCSLIGIRQETGLVAATVIGSENVK